LRTKTCPQTSNLWYPDLFVREGRCFAVGFTRLRVSDAFFQVKGETMNKRVALQLLLACVLAPVSQAQIKHIEMRVEGMT
jgi:hypothetical protein